MPEAKKTIVLDTASDRDVGQTAAPARGDRAAAGSFAKKLGQLIHGRGMRQSVLAREAGLEPYLISNYMRGKAVPSKVNLLAIARALNVPPETLTSEKSAGAEISAKNSPLSLVINPANPSAAILRVNMEVSLEVGSQIVSILSRYVSGDAAAVGTIESDDDQQD